MIPRHPVDPTGDRIRLVSPEQDPARLGLPVDEVVGVAEARHVARELGSGDGFQRDVLGDLDYRMSWMATVIKAAPMVGLLGTVMGMTLAELEDATPEIFDFAGLGEFKNLQLKYFSSGMAARLAYSIAFRAVREGVLILDEIFAVGDAEFRERCKERYHEIHRAGNAIILVSHNPDHIAGFCERAVLLEKGRVTFQGTGEDVAQAYQDLLEPHEHVALAGVRTD